jgi:ATP adenylyltransferase
VSLEHLWATWRSAYVATDAARQPAPDRDGSLFEQILTSDLPDEQTFVVRRTPTCAVLLNIYPYTSGHLMVLPQRAAAGLADLTPDEERELWALVRQATVALESAYSCEGLNVGINLGAAGGAGIPGHLHVHVLPRWGGDTNFMTSVADTRVLPESLVETWAKVRAAWPEEGSAEH